MTPGKPKLILELAIPCCVVYNHSSFLLSYLKRSQGTLDIVLWSRCSKLTKLPMCVLSSDDSDFDDAKFKFSQSVSPIKK